VNVVDMPIKCPVARSNSASWPTPTSQARHSRSGGVDVRDPLDGAFTNPCAPSSWADARRSRHQTGHRVQYGCRRRHRRSTHRVRRKRDSLRLAVVIPVHSGQLRRQLEELGDELGFIEVDEHTLQSTTSPNVFAIGDAAALSASKAAPWPISKERCWSRTSIDSSTDRTRRLLRRSRELLHRVGSSGPCSLTSTTRRSR